MKIFRILSLSLFVSVNVTAQQYPLEWKQYVAGGYLYDIQNDIRATSESEYSLKNRLADVSRINLAKQVKIKIEDNATLYVTSDNGYTDREYVSLTQFSTNLDMKLVETRTYYNPETNEGYAIAFVEKRDACRYYENEFFQLINTLENTLIIAENYSNTGYKESAKTELKSKLPLLENIEEVLFWLNIFDFSSETLKVYQMRKSNIERQLKQIIADLQHSLLIYLECNAQISGNHYPKLQNEIKGLIAKDGCSFTTDKSEADYAIIINASNDEGFESEFYGVKSYYTYVSASIVIDKILTSQRIYEDELMIKGGHTRGLKEAAIAGYKEIKEKIADTIISKIRE